MHGTNEHKWLVVFCDPIRNPDLFGPMAADDSWHSRACTSAISWCKPGFRHVFAMRPCLEGWLVVDNRANGMGVITAPHNHIAVIRELESQGVIHTVSAVQDHPDRPQGFLGSGLLSCVLVVRRLLGVRKHVLTPYALYRHLKGQAHGRNV